MKDYKLAYIKITTAKAIIEYLVTTAQHFLAILTNYLIESHLKQQIGADLKSNIERMRL